MKEASKMFSIMLKIGLYPCIDSHSVSGEILSHFEANAIKPCNQENRHFYCVQHVHHVHCAQ